MRTFFKKIVLRLFPELQPKIHFVGYEPRSEFERGIVDVVNIYRSQHGKPELRHDGIYASFQSIKHSVYLATNIKQISHANYGIRVQFLNETVKATNVGEVIGYGYKDPDSLLAAWSNSHEHKEVLLGNYKYIGIGYAKHRRSYFVTAILWQ